MHADGWKRLAAVGGAVVVLATTIAGVAEARAPGRAAAATPDTTKARFVSRCDYSHAGPDDPIVHPNMPGMSHLHQFFGNTTTAADSTYESLRAGGSTCKNQRDTAGYWVPALSLDGQVVEPTKITAYYRNRGMDHASIRPFPAGLKMVAGDASATAPQPEGHVYWNCGPDDTTPPSATAPTCPRPTLKLHIQFPNCWDGTSLDSTDHKSHMAYATRGSCPDTHPVPVPALQLNVSYPINGGPGVSLSSGGQLSGHGDFFNAWDQDEQARLVQSCINAGIVCKPGPAGR
jgi:hypothetical protein